jgi:hypothetical protein
MDGIADTIVSAHLIFIIRRGLSISAMLAEFMRNASPNPAHLHDVHFTAARANALHLRFAEPFNLEHLIRL